MARTYSRDAVEILPCPICGDEKNELKQCERAEGRPRSYTFRCPTCGTRAFLRDDIYQRLVAAKQVYPM